MPPAKEIQRCLDFYKTKRSKKGKQLDIPADVLSILGELDLEHPKTPADQEALVAQLQERLQEARGRFKPLVEAVPAPAPADLAPKGVQVALDVVQSVAAKEAPAVGTSLNKSERKYQQKAEEQAREIVELRKQIQELTEGKVVDIHEAQKAERQKFDAALAKKVEEFKEAKEQAVQRALQEQYDKAEKAAKSEMLKDLQQKEAAWARERATMQKDLEDLRQEMAARLAALAPPEDAEQLRRQVHRLETTVANLRATVGNLQATVAELHRELAQVHTVVAQRLWDELQSYPTHPVNRRKEIWNKMVKSCGWHTDKVQQSGLSSEGFMWKFVNGVCQAMNGKLN